MRILVVGGGSREHALAWKLSENAEVIVAPGNPGIGLDFEVVPISAKNHQALLDLCKSRSIDLVVVGPEDPLIDGLADFLRTADVVVYGPGKEGATLEASKAFSKALMNEAGVPTALFETFTDPVKAREFAKRRFDAGKMVAVKASGNALGKGVVVSSTFEEAADAIQSMMVDKQFGSAGETVVIEDRLCGPEFSLLTIVGDQNFVSLPVARDYKRAHNGDQGPNTGGMGAYSPVEEVSIAQVREIEETIVKPTLDRLRARGISYRGTLFSGIMMDDDQPYCLEFNVRMGDPETQAVMLRVASGFGQALFAAASGDRVESPSIYPNSTVAVVVTSEHYPILNSQGSPITVLELPRGGRLFYAGAAIDGEGNLVTNGGRIVTAVGCAHTLIDAREIAYQAAASIRFEGARYRSDIAAFAQ